MNIDVNRLIGVTQKMTLLYVEDNENARIATTSVFEDFFKDVLVAVDGEDGLEKFQNNSIDIIITDINMPKMNGLEMIERIRKIDRNIPILVLSAYNESGYFMESIKLGVEGYLLKPIDIDQYLGILEKVTEKIILSKEIIKSNNLLEQYKELTDKSAIVTILDLEHKITYANDAFCKISGYRREELIGRNYDEILKYRQPDNIYKEIWDTLNDKKDIWQGVLKFVSKSGHIYYLKTTIKSILDENGNIVEYMSFRDDVSEIMNPK
jgi:PAS domain S-box-containing protein